MTRHTHQNAPTQFVDADGIHFAYRRFGKGGGTPLVFMQHFRGGMDHWDPAVTDRFAEHRPVILFDNTGVAASTGERFRLRAEGRDPEISEQVAPAQLEALAKWGAPRVGAFDYLRGIT